MTCRAHIRGERKAVQRADASLRKHKEALRLSDAEKRKAELARLAQDHVDQAVKAMPDSGAYLAELYRAVRDHRKATRPAPKDAAEALFKAPISAASRGWECQIGHAGCVRNCGNYGCGN